MLIAQKPYAIGPTEITCYAYVNDDNTILEKNTSNIFLTFQNVLKISVSNYTIPSDQMKKIMINNVLLIMSLWVLNTIYIKTGYFQLFMIIFSSNPC